MKEVESKDMNPFFEIGLCLMDVALILYDVTLKKCEPYLKRIEAATIRIQKERGDSECTEHANAK